MLLVQLCLHKTSMSLASLSIVRDSFVSSLIRASWWSSSESSVGKIVKYPWVGDYWSFPIWSRLRVYVSYYYYNYLLHGQFVGISAKFPSACFCLAVRMVCGHQARLRTKPAKGYMRSTRSKSHTYLAEK